jgi:hypothetical protein
MFLSGDQRVLAWGCSRCKNKPEGDISREERGCDKDSDYVNLEWAPELRRCPWSQLDQKAFALWSLYLKHKDSERLFELMDEPAWVYQAVALCGRVAAQWHAQLLKQASSS